MPAESRVARVAAPVRWGATIAAAVVVAAGMVLLGHSRFAPLIAWDAAALVLLGTFLADSYRADGERTRALARSGELWATTADIVVLAAAVASIAGVVELLLGGASRSYTERAIVAGVAISSVVISWFTVHTLYMFRYAQLHYTDGTSPSVDFNEGDGYLPTFGDFAYLAFTIGMTYQVSDTAFTGPSIRRAALRHAMLSFLFGTTIIATAISALASLVR